MGISECLSPGAKTYSMGGLTVGCDNKSIGYDSAAGFLTLKKKPEAPKYEAPKLPAVPADAFVGPPPRAPKLAGPEPAKGLAVEIDGNLVAVPPPKTPYAAAPAAAGVSLPPTAKAAPVRFTFTEAPALAEVTKQKPVRYGHKDGGGSAVSDLQSKLKAAGFEVEVDGFFGKDTMKAVKAFQKANGLPPDGKVGPATLAALEAAAKAKTPEVPLDGNAPVPQPIGDGIGFA